MRLGLFLLTGVLVGATAVYSLLAGTGRRAVAAGQTRQSSSGGAAIVLNRELAPNADLPPITSVLQSSGQAARVARAAGLYVIEDPTGSCLVLMGTWRAPAGSAGLAALPDAVLASWFIDALPRAQIPHPEPELRAPSPDGSRAPYLSPHSGAEVIKSFSDPAAGELLKRYRLRDEPEAAPDQAVPSTEARVLPSSMAYVVSSAADGVAAFPVILRVRPPTRVVVEARPVQGSLLWWMWRYREASWGARRVTLKAGTYGLKDLGAKLSQSTGLEVRIDYRVPDTKIAVAAEGAPLAKILWALSIATGLVAVPLPAQDPDVVFLKQETRLDAQRRQEAGGIEGDEGNSVAILQLLSYGYTSPLQAPAWRDLLRQPDEYGTPDGERSMGWRMADLPVLYQNEILSAAQRAIAAPTGKRLGVQMPLNPQRTVVFWIKGLTLSLGEPGGRTGIRHDIFVPAF